MEESGPDQSQNAFYHPVQYRLSSSLLVRHAEMKVYKTVTLHRLEGNMKVDLKGTGEFMNWIHVTWNNHGMLCEPCNECFISGREFLV